MSRRRRRCSGSSRLSSNKEKGPGTRRITPRAGGIVDAVRQPGGKRWRPWLSVVPLDGAAVAVGAKAFYFHPDIFGFIE
jgi:hypothetical protein